MNSHKLADTAMVTTWLAWIFGFITQINQVLQMLAFIAAIISSVIAARFYWKGTRK